MSRRLAREDLTALARGYALLGSGGGGTTHMLELMLAESAQWPIEVVEHSDVDPDTPCLGVAFVGSTMLLSERLPALEPFATLLTAVERWLGYSVPAVCSLEGGGMNGLAALTLAGSRIIVDADGTGRAVPSLDQMSLFVDRVPGLVFASETGAGGIALIETDRGIDAERVVRSAIIQAGGAGCTVLGGFTVGDLHEHAMTGHLERALALGRAFLNAASLPLVEFCAALGGDLLAAGRVAAVLPYAGDPYVQTIEINGIGGVMHRLVTRSETLAVLSDGRLVTSSPTIIVALDAMSRDILEVTDLLPGRNVAIVALPAPEWWLARPERLGRVLPSAYGLRDLDAA